MSITYLRTQLLNLLLMLVAACGGGGASPATGSPGPLRLNLQQVAANLDSPVFLTAPTGDARLFIVERPGRIRIVQNGTLLAAPFLDIHDRTTSNVEGGLPSLAFHPQYATN